MDIDNTPTIVIVLVPLVIIMVWEIVKHVSYTAYLRIRIWFNDMTIEAISRERNRRQDV